MDRVRRQLMEALGAAFEGFDALIGPSFCGDALFATNLTGNPQLAIRAGYAQTPIRGRNGQTAAGGETRKAPRSVSLWDDLFQEGATIALGAALERGLGAAAGRPPGF